MVAQPEVGLKLAIIYLCLFLLGWGYNALVAWAEGKKYLEGHTAYAVAGGITFTLAPFIMFAYVPILWVYMAFVASGTPMILGAWLRYVTAREADQKEQKTKPL
jgi:hypothetical protein